MNPFRPPCWARALALLIIVCCGCAHAVPAPPPPAAVHAPSPFEVVGRILADACTSQETDAVLIEHAAFLLKSCHLPPAVCVRRTCIRLGRDDEGSPYRETTR